MDLTDSIDPLDNTIHIAKGRSAEQTLSTIIHEMAHL